MTVLFTRTSSGAPARSGRRAIGSSTGAPARSGRRATGSSTGAPTRPSGAARTKTAASGQASRSSAPFVALVAVVVCFTLFGLTMVLSASSVDALTRYGSPWGQFRSQAMWLGIGLVACVCLACIDHRLLRRLTLPGLIASFILLVLVLTPGFGVAVNEAQRWLRLGPIQFQPSELAKLALVLFLADNLARSRAVDRRRSVKPIIIVLTAYGGLILLQPNLGTTIILFLIGISTLFAAGVQLRLILAMSAVSAVAATALAYVAPYRRARLLAFMDPWNDHLGNGWQTIQSLVSVANGGVTGVGIGESRGKYGFLPEAHTDFVFAVTAEEFGLVGAGLVVVGYVIFGLLSLTIARRADRFGALLVIGISSWVIAQAFINIGAVLGVLPITGVPLPFMSAGGTSLVVTLAGVGIMLNVARSNR